MPLVPLINDTGIKITINTKVVVSKAAVSPPIASTVALYADLYPASKRACTASTTTIESSTTVPMTKTSAKSVSIFTEKPATAINAKVPISDTTIPNAGISVARKSCTKRYTTISTSRIASSSVMTTSRIEAKRKSLVLSKVMMRMSLGRFLSVSARSLSIS